MHRARLTLVLVMTVAVLQACASHKTATTNMSTGEAQAVDTGKEIVVNTDKGQPVAQQAGAAACQKKGKTAQLTGYTCAEGTCKVLRYTFDCV